MKKLFNLMDRIRREKRGNVLMMTGFAIIPLTAATGMGIDYARAARIDTKLSAAADAASLAAVSKPMMAKSNADAKAYAENVFKQQAALIPDFSYDPATDLAVSVTGTAGSDREVTISFNGKSRNVFGSLLGLTTLNVGSEVKSKASLAPDIDFHVIMDTSPSMLFPTTQVAIERMKTETGGCAYACHQGDQSSTAPDMINYRGARRDYYGVAQKWNADNPTELIEFRFFKQLEAVSSLMNFAYTKGLAQRAEYNMIINQFDKAVQSVQSRIQITDGNASFSSANRDTAAAAALTAKLYIPWKNSHDKDGVYDNDQQTHFDSMTNSLNTTGGSFYVSDPGNGTGLAGDSAQKIVLIISDGFNEQSRYSNPGFGTVDVTKCDALKARGIKVAVLYLKVYASGWSTGDNKINDSRISLQQCATQGLFQTVETGANITEALENLFDQSIATPRLTS